jgi:ribosomal protein L40E
MLTVRVCGRCGFNNPIDSAYCNRCGSTLDIKTAVEATKTEEEVKDMLPNSVKDPKIIEDIVRKYIEDKRKKSKR